MVKFKVGDKVKEKRKNEFGLDGKTCIVTKVRNKPFFHYNVKCPGISTRLEFHKGELKKVKK